MKKKSIKLLAEAKEVLEEAQDCYDNLDDLREMWGKFNELNDSLIKNKEDDEVYQEVLAYINDILNFIGNIPFTDEVESDIEDAIDKLDELEE